MRAVVSRPHGVWRRGTKMPQFMPPHAASANTIITDKARKNNLARITTSWD